ncbi:hypothetical protein SAMN05216299_107116 [Nitrosospira sp. Nsp14]|nr:hypothetical protein SAMN05216299_107116 [Nitrosospira sp. Nsp14]
MESKCICQSWFGTKEGVMERYRITKHGQAPKPELEICFVAPEAVNRSEQVHCITAIYVEW